MPVWVDELEESINQYFIYPIDTLPNPFINEFIEVERVAKIWERFGNAPNYNQMDNRNLLILESYDSWVSYWETHTNNEGLS